MTTSGTCPAFSTSYPGYVACGPIRACPGDTIVAGDCALTTGDTYFRLIDSTGYQVTYNDDGCSSNSGSMINYPVPLDEACQDYTINQSCYSGDAIPCTGTTTWTVTAGDPFPEPTPAPTPLYFPTSSANGSCSPFSAASSGEEVGCGPITACPGETVTVGDCGACTGDTFFYLDDASGAQVDSNDDGCSDGGCSKIVYTAPTGSVGCQAYTVRQTCYAGNSNSCGGNTTYQIGGAPTLTPTMAPSKGIEAYVAIYDAMDYTCVAGVNQTMVVDSRACSPIPSDNNEMTIKVECASNAPNATWTASLYFGDPGCVGEPNEVTTGGGSDDSCETCYFEGYLNRAIEVNCGGTACIPPPRAYFNLYYQEQCFGASGGRIVDLNECVATPYLNTPYAIFSCNSLNDNSPWQVNTFLDADCTSVAQKTLQGDNACSCPGVGYSYAATMNCGGQGPSPLCTEAPSVAPTVVPVAFVSLFEQNTPDEACGHQTGGAWKALDKCIQLTYQGPYGIIHCDSYTPDSAWTVQAFSGETCDPSTLLGFNQRSNACACSPLSAITVDDGQDDYYDDDILGFSMKINCSGNDTTICPAQPKISSSSSSGMSSAEVGGIVGGVLGGVLVITLVGLWFFGVIGFAASSSASSSGAAASTGAAGTAPAGSATDVEMSVNPMAPPSKA